jgi:hypothetical protein
LNEVRIKVLDVRKEVQEGKGGGKEKNSYQILF